MEFNAPSLISSNPQVDQAYRIAIGDVCGNILPFQDGLLEAPAPVLLAGLDYNTPWTRDAAINVWNGVGLWLPEVSRNTLVSVLERGSNGAMIGGQYWDSILWSVGAWAFYLYSGNRGFLRLALEATRNSLARLEQEEFDPQYGLFRGPAVYGDGVAAYPDRYAQTNGSSSILEWPAHHPVERAPKGFGLPMMALSTNCVYYQAYRLAGAMAVDAGQRIDPSWSEKAQSLRANIQKHFWNPQSGAFRYLVDRWGGCESQEGLGSSFALLFGVAEADQVGKVIENQVIPEAGIPCVWPNFERYASPEGMRFGRHAGTIWPPIQAFWAEAVARAGRLDRFAHEFERLTRHIVRDAQCAEIYHPLTGEIYGGVQEGGTGADGMQWASCRRQTWSATAYLRMIWLGLTGMRVSPEGAAFQPFLPPGLEDVFIQGLPYRGGRLDIHLRGQGNRLEDFKRNGVSGRAFVPADITNTQVLEIRLGGAS